MYGELSGPEGSAFESHLLDCGECTDEFATISAARYEVYDWRKLAFDPLETPHFEIPFDVDENFNPSWVDRIRVAFASGWAAPAFALGALAIVCVIATAFILSSNTTTDLALNTSNVGAPDTTVATAAEASVAVDTNGRRVNETQAVGEAVSDPAQRRGSQRRTVRFARAAQPRAIEAKAASARNKQIPVPRLNEFPEDEDKSLRLAELFDDIETSD